MKHAPLQEQAVLLLGKIASCHSESKRAVRKAGGAGAIVRSMDAHLANSRLQELGCTALATLAHGDAHGHRTVRKAEAASAAVRALLAHPLRYM